MAKAVAAYFSASGATRKLTENLAGVIGADTFAVYHASDCEKAPI